MGIKVVFFIHSEKNNAIFVSFQNILKRQNQLTQLILFKIFVMDIESYWKMIRFAKTDVKKELVKRLEQAIKSEICRNKLYEDPRWRNKRSEVLERDNHKCQICGCVAQEVHHIKYKGNSYNEPWNIENDYLVSLCKECHSRFNGTSSDDYVFIPAPQPILLRKYGEECYNLYRNEVLEIPVWNNVKPVLESFTHRTNYPIKDLELAIYYPLSSKIWRKYILKDYDGYDELDCFIDSIRYSPEEFESAIKSFEIWKNHLPFLSKNYDFAISQLKHFYKLSLLTPKKGLFVIAIANKKKGRYIKIIDIQKGEIVKSIDLSNDNERKGVCIADLRIISILYAIEYLQNQHNGCLSDIPIFSTFPYASVKPYHYRNIYAEYANTPSLSSIDEWKFEIMKRIGTDHHCRIFQWKKKLWGDGPIYNE